MTESRDDNWLRVLSGEAEPQTREERQAASLKNMFQRRSATELSPPVDPQRQKRLINRIETDPLLGRANPGRAPSSPARPGMFKRVVDWLLPPGGSPTRLSLAAAALAVTVALPLFFQAGQDDDMPQMRGLPPGVAPPAIGNGPAQVMFVTDPAGVAQRLVQSLAAQGVPATAIAVGDQAVDVVAQVPVAQRAAVADLLARQGLAAPEGDVRIRFQRSP